MGTTKGSKRQDPFFSSITSSEFHAEWVERAKHNMTMKGNELAMSALHPNLGLRTVGRSSAFWGLSSRPGRLIPTQDFVWLWPRFHPKFYFILFFVFLESALFPVFIYLFIYYNNWEKCQIAGDLPSALFDVL